MAADRGVDVFAEASPGVAFPCDAFTAVAFGSLVFAPEVFPSTVFEAELSESAARAFAVGEPGGLGTAFFGTAAGSPGPGTFALGRALPSACATAFAPPAAFSPEAEAAAPAGLSGTEGNRCAKISAARTRGVSASATASRSCFCVTTRTSSRRFKSADGLI